MTHGKKIYQSILKRRQSNFEGKILVPKFLTDPFRRKTYCALIKRSGIPARFIEQKWLPKNKLAVKESYYITGPVGSGKTTLACDIAKRLIGLLAYSGEAINAKVMFFGVGELLAFFRSICFSPNSSEDNESDFFAIENFFGNRIDFLFLDDLGTEKVTEWGKEKLYNVINARYNNHKHICITSNHSLDKAAAYLDDKVISRISEMCVLTEVNHSDRRIEIER